MKPKSVYKHHLAPKICNEPEIILILMLKSWSTIYLWE